MFDMIKTRCGIAKTTKVYDDDIQMYINDCLLDLRDSGVPQKTVEKEDERVITAVTLYVKAHLGNDRSDTEKYMKLYQRKVFRLTLDEEETSCGMEAYS